MAIILSCIWKYGHHSKLYLALITPKQGSSTAHDSLEKLAIRKNRLMPKFLWLSLIISHGDVSTEVRLAWWKVSLKQCYCRSITAAMRSCQCNFYLQCSFNWPFVSRRYASECDIRCIYHRGRFTFSIFAPSIVLALNYALSFGIARNFSSFIREAWCFAPSITAVMSTNIWIFQYLNKWNIISICICAISPVQIYSHISS